jgi:hypothetical protein
MKFLFSVTLMLSLASATLASVPSLAMRGRLLQKRNRKNQASGRKLDQVETSSCTFEAVVASECSLDDFCIALSEEEKELLEYYTGLSEELGFPEELELELLLAQIPVSSLSCGGNVESTWYIHQTYPSVCGYDFSPYNETTFDPETDYCYGETYIQYFGPDGVHTHDETTDTYTQPAEGTILYMYSYIVCDEAAYDEDDNGEEWGGVYYCTEVSCPDVLEINGMPCEEERCGECPDGLSETWSCTDVDPTLVEECGAEEYSDCTLDCAFDCVGECLDCVDQCGDAPEDFFNNLAAYFRTVTLAPTSSPMASTSGVAPRKQAMTFAFAMIALAMLL